MAARQAFRALSGRNLFHPGLAVQYRNMANKVGIVGPAGKAEEALKCFEQRNFPADEVKLFALEKHNSTGKTVTSTKYGEVAVEPYDVDAVEDCDVVFEYASSGFKCNIKEHLVSGEHDVEFFASSLDVPLESAALNAVLMAERAVKSSGK